jgi:protein-tyrosine phosphatase
VLPGLDDGPATEDGAVALAGRAWQEGTAVLVATPHVNRHFRPSPGEIAVAAERLRARLDAEGIEIDLRTGAEVAMEQAVALDDETLAALRLGGGAWLLLESPYEPAGPELERAVDGLQERGNRIVLAHPERSPALRDHPRRLRALVERGVRCSITAASLEGRFGPAPQWSSLELLRDGLAHSIDSDAHDAVHRPPGLRAGVAAALARLPALEAATERLTTSAAAEMLDD